MSLFLGGQCTNGSVCNGRCPGESRSCAVVSESRCSVGCDPTAAKGTNSLLWRQYKRSKPREENVSAYNQVLIGVSLLRGFRQGLGSPREEPRSLTITCDYHLCHSIAFTYMVPIAWWWVGILRRKKQTWRPAQSQLLLREEFLIQTQVC